MNSRWTLIGLLLFTGVLYVWGLGASGWANSFYSAAVQAGSQSWKAFFFGSSDAASAITVDKTPAALWPMALSARLFGLNSWSILVPQALMGVATVWTVYVTVRRHFPAWAGLLAGLVMALTPVAVLMFRFNNPDALLVLLLAVAAYCVVRAQERAGTRWLVLAGVCIGFAFLAKMLQAFLVLPGFALVYLVAAPASWWRRIRQLLLAGVAMVVAAGWWLVAVALVPAADRPFIGGSQSNSVLELALGYNGIGRINGGDYGGLGNLNQQAGWFRLFDTEAGGQISWLLPAALLLLGGGLWVTRQSPRTDPVRASLLLWGSWLVVTGVIFSLMQGIFHAYYTVALAPALAALVGMGAALLWERRAFVFLAGVVAVTGGWSYVLLSRASGWNTWLGPTILAAALTSAAALLIAARPTPVREPVPTRPDPVRGPAEDGTTPVAILGGTTSVAVPAGTTSAAVPGGAAPAGGSVAGRGGVVRGSVVGRGGVVRGFVVGVGAVVAVAAGLAGPAAYAADTVASAHTGAIPTAGPNTGGRGGPAGFGGRDGSAGRGGFAGQDGFGGQGGTPGGPQPQGQQPQGQQPGTTQSQPGTTQGQPGGRFGGRGGMGGLLGAGTPSAEVSSMLRQDASKYTWVAAVVGSNNAAGYQLATGSPVMAVGGFNGTDPSPTLEQFKQYVQDGKIHYFVGGAGTGQGQAAEIAAWVQETFTPTTVNGVTLYDLTG